MWLDIAVPVLALDTFLVNVSQICDGIQMSQLCGPLVIVDASPQLCLAGAIQTCEQLVCVQIACLQEFTHLIQPFSIVHLR